MTRRELLSAATATIIGSCVGMPEIQRLTPYSLDFAKPEGKMHRFYMWEAPSKYCEYTETYFECIETPDHKWWRIWEAFQDPTNRRSMDCNYIGPYNDLGSVFDAHQKDLQKFYS